MKTNINAADRAARLILFAVIAILYFTGNITGAAGVILGILALVLLFTSFTGFCPIYRLFQFSTLRKKS